MLSLLISRTNTKMLIYYYLLIIIAVSIHSLYSNINSSFGTDTFSFHTFDHWHFISFSKSTVKETNSGHSA